ncbi:MAG: AAA family ATPase [Alteromonas stellipolaris]|uniref:AAA family ATPase n=1 Tax=Alteromonas stellipolaris TaxID=233316 RepID=UPI003B8E0ADF
MDNLVEKEKSLANSKIREVFTPFSPVKRSDLLSGREREISQVLSIINTPGQHALIYGDRGIGKSSVANIISEMMRESFDRAVYVKKCSSLDTFKNIVEKALLQLGFNANSSESIEETHENKGAKAGIAGFGANLQSSKKISNKVDYDTLFNSPSRVADCLINKEALLVIDEADLLQNETTKIKLAEFIKYLSDLNSKLKVLIVGIGHTGNEMVSHHPSIERCLSEVHLPPISLLELRNIITTGCKEIEIDFNNDVIDDIVDISCGYPHFVHLIALKCAEDAFLSGTKNVDEDTLPRALKLAVENSEGGLRRTYEVAVKLNNCISRKVLLAASLCHSRGFLVSELCEMTNEAIDKDISKASIRSVVSRWINDESLNMLSRVERGHYRFTDPRMMSFIKMVNGFTYDKKTIVADILREEYSKRYVG